MALSQQEIEALVNSIMEREASGEAEARVVKPKLRMYDFRRPAKFSKDHLKGAQLLFDHFSRQFTSHFSNLLRTSIHANVSSVDEATYKEFLAGLSSTCCVGVVAWSDRPHGILVDFAPRIALPMLDRLCGGAGDALSVPRPLTEIEMAMARKIIEGSVGILRGALREFRIDVPALSVTALEVNPLFIEQAMSPNEMVLTATIAVKMGSASGVIVFCLPFALLEPFLPALAATRWYVRGNALGEGRNGEAPMSEAISDVEAPLGCRLGEVFLSVQDILALREGDIVDLGVPQNGYGVLHVFGKPKFLVKVGYARGRLAAKIVGTKETGREDLL